VKSHQADFGIALDGDADRLQVVDHMGRLFNGDELLYVLAKDRLQQGQIVSGVVGTQMTNKGVELALAKLNISLVRAKVGDRYVLEKLQEHHWLLGGEGSGHLLMLDKHTSGDGLISGLQVIQACLRANTSLSMLLDEVQLFAQHMINVKLQDGLDWKNHAQFQQGCLALEKKLGDHGRILIRPSGTEPVLRIMVEAPEMATAKTSAEQLSQLLN
jgi:phosphoglucosamine mutase